jgi:hypothetical protein
METLLNVLRAYSATKCGYQVPIPEFRWSNWIGGPSCCDCLFDWLLLLIDCVLLLDLLDCLPCLCGNVN